MVIFAMKNKCSHFILLSLSMALCLSPQIVVFLPALCRKMGVPYCIIKGKARFVDQLL